MSSVHIGNLCSVVGCFLPKCTFMKATGSYVDFKILNVSLLEDNVWIGSICLGVEMSVSKIYA